MDRFRFVTTPFTREIKIEQRFRADFIEVDSLAYLSLEGMLSVMKDKSAFCHACFTGQYPVQTPRNKSKYLLEGGKK